MCVRACARARARVCVCVYIYNLNQEETFGQAKFWRDGVIHLTKNALHIYRISEKIETKLIQCFNEVV